GHQRGHAHPDLPGGASVAGPRCRRHALTMPSRSSVRARLVWPERSRLRVEGGEEARPATMPNRCLGELSRRSPDVWQSAGRAIELGALLPLLPLAARALLIVCGPTPGTPP